MCTDALSPPNAIRFRQEAQRSTPVLAVQEIECGTGVDQRRHRLVCSRRPATLGTVSPLASERRVYAGRAHTRRPATRGNGNRGEESIALRSSRPPAPNTEPRPPPRGPLRGRNSPTPGSRCRSSSRVARANTKCAGARASITLTERPTIARSSCAYRAHLLPCLWQMPMPTLPRVRWACSTACRPPSPRTRDPARATRTVQHRQKGVRIGVDHARAQGARGYVRHCGYPATPQTL
jgi:hypothetical protein